MLLAYFFTHENISDLKLRMAHTKEPKLQQLEKEHCATLYVTLIPNEKLE
jgi:hypothetical protein